MLSRHSCVIALALLVVPTLLACRRSASSGPPPDAGSPTRDQGPLVCVEQPDGCVFCAGSQEQGSFLEPDQSRPLVCDPADDESCVEFCSQSTPPCALPWWKGKSCLVDSDIEFRRALFNLRTADRPEVVLAGRAVDESGKRITGASIRVWLSWGAWPGLVPLVEEVSGKDGGFRIPLRSGPWAYSIRVSHPEHATSIADKIAADRLDRNGSVRLFRMAAMQTVRGRVVDLATGLPVPGATIQAARAADDPIQVAEAESGEDGGFVIGGLESRRYVLKVSKFGWRPLPVNPPVQAPAQRVTLKLMQANVIRGSVIDADGEAEPSATVAAVLASAPGVPSPPIVWTSDNEGRFAQDHFLAGTYYLWARRGDMLAYPPSRIELTDNHVVEVRIALSHRGARVSGQVALESGHRPPGGPGSGPGDISVELVSRSPLSFPRNPVAKVDSAGRFLLTGVLPGRYRLAIKSGIRAMAIARGPREVELPIEPGSVVPLKEPIVVRPRVED
jgi:hypothetical protein